MSDIEARVAALERSMESALRAVRMHADKLRALERGAAGAAKADAVDRDGEPLYSVNSYLANKWVVNKRGSTHLVCWCREKKKAEKIAAALEAMEGT